jgi:hypothetical protein
MTADQRVEMPWPPASVQVAEDTALALSDGILMIQAQLAEKNHTDENGKRLSDHEYQAWRARAVWALHKKTIERRRLSRWLLAQKRRAYAVEQGVETPKNVVELVGALQAAFRDAIGWEDMTERERALVILAQDWVRTKGVAILERAKAGENGQVAS